MSIISKYKAKLLNKSGSAMNIVIVLLTMLFIFIPIIMNQLSNQIKSNINSYEEIKYKYLAEAGIERAIYDIEKEVYEGINNTNKEFDIAIPNYQISQNDDGDIKFKDLNLNSEGDYIKTAKVYLEMEGDKIKNVKLDELEDLNIESRANNHKVRVNIDFVFNKNENTYDISQNIKSYDITKE